MTSKIEEFKLTEVVRVRTVQGFTRRSAERHQKQQKKLQQFEIKTTNVKIQPPGSRILPVLSEPGNGQTHGCSLLFPF